MIKPYPRGRRGQTGATGATGATGSTGPAGATGPAGVGFATSTTSSTPTLFPWNTWTTIHNEPVNENEHLYGRLVVAILGHDATPQPGATFIVDYMAKRVGAAAVTLLTPKVTTIGDLQNAVIQYIVTGGGSVITWQVKHTLPPTRSLDAHVGITTSYHRTTGSP